MKISHYYYYGCYCQINLPDIVRPSIIPKQDKLLPNKCGKLNFPIDFRFDSWSPKSQNYKAVFWWVRFLKYRSIDIE